MKRIFSRAWYPLLVAEGAACAVLAMLLQRQNAGTGEALPALLAFPFAQLGAGLRALSLAGGAGNALAWVLYGLLCLLPVGAALGLRRRGRGGRENGLLVVTGVLLVPVLYGMINPALLGGWFPAQLPTAMVQATCGAALWLCLLSWAVLRVLRALPRRSIGTLLGHLGGLLTVLAALVVAQTCGFALYDLLADLDALAQANTALSVRELRPTLAFRVLQYAVEALPAVLTVMLLHKAQALLTAARADRYGEQTVAAAERLAAFCRTAVAVPVLALLGFALVQLLCAPRLMNLQSDLTLPLGDVTLALAALVWARWMAEGQALKEENEGFI